jgi:hypothetical protein
MNFSPTAEQHAALEAFATGETLVIEAGAGTGKTSTLVLLAESTHKRGQYVAFNKSIVDEAGRKMPAHVACNTAHSLAFRAVGRRYQHRLNSPRMKSAALARQLGIDPIDVVVGGVERKRMAPGYLASHVLRAVTRFCQTADPEPTAQHFAYIDGIDMPAPDGKRRYDNNNLISQALLPALRKAWADISDPDGQLPFKHEHYLKAWQLGEPRIDAEVIYFDEAQDANPVMHAIVAAQTHAQIVWVGDSQQQIYGFTGAVNAMAALGDQVTRTFLTQSFRFGPVVADLANTVLERLAAPLRLQGYEPIPSTVARLDAPSCWLTRTNARAVGLFLAAVDEGRRAHLVGGAGEVRRFAEASISLRDSGWTPHPELACFKSWSEVQDYVADDPQGSELKLMVDLVDRFGAEVILEATERMPREDRADVVISTAHKSKGREWDTVRLGDDFPDGEKGDLSEEELRLMYVAVTRAKLVIDPFDAPILDRDQTPAPNTPVAASEELLGQLSLVP